MTEPARCDVFRGHRIHWDEAARLWLYDDTGEPTATTWRDRPCGHWGKFRTPEGHDPCWGEIPGAMNACCGHGEEATAYVQMIDGTVIQGEDAITLVHCLVELRDER